jgi:hypothetical protein
MTDLIYGIDETIKGLERVKKTLIHWFLLNSESSPTPDPTPATIVHTTVDIAPSTPANVFIYEPEGIETPPTNGWRW